jgi:hypothetical protein
MSGPLDHSPADIIRRLLIRLGHGTLPTDSGNWPIYIAILPSKPDKLLVVTDTAGIQQGNFHIGEAQESHGIQVTVRSTDHENGFQKAREIAVALDEVTNTTIGLSGPTGTGTTDYTIYSITKVSGPLPLGTETPESKRRLFTINSRVALVQSP